MKNLTALLTALIIAGCASTEPSAETSPLYNRAPEKVGYMEKFNYWQPAQKQAALSPRAQATRNRLSKHGAVVLTYQYDIDSNGRVHNITLLQANPAGSATTEELLSANVIFSSWQAVAANSAQVPVTVTERIVFTPSGIAIPPDDMPINEFLKSLSQHR